MTLTPDMIRDIESRNADARLSYFRETVKAQKAVYILVDDDGAVMLNAEEEDCIPVWPNPEFAASWATDDWQGCEPKEIDLATWRARWTRGMEEDELYVAVFPVPGEDGMLMSPDEFESHL